MPAQRLPSLPAAPRDGRCLHTGDDYTSAVTATVPAPPAETPPGVLGRADVGRDDRSLRRFLHGLPPVDEAGLERRSAWLAGRRVAASAERQVLDLAVSMVDLTTLEGADTPGRVRALCAQAHRPEPTDPEVPQVAAVCVYPDLAAVAAEALRGSPVGIAAVATAFPSGRASLPVKLADTALALDGGATEIDMVIDRGAWLAGRYGQAHDEIVAVRALVDGRAHLKVILETGELPGYDDVRRAAWLALLAGADMVKTSTGKTSPAATLPVVQVLLQAVRDWYRTTGERRGVKAAGGIRHAQDAVRHLVAVHEVAGPAWLTPALFRFGASSLLDDLLRRRRTAR
ncbi:MAG: deoxyribose-phosphate aldolase [Pseudonocardia sp.]|nr:deoxyribose-phosphate aldolase [Pseudonocardia sp.]